MPKRIFRGKVISDKNDKTITVRVERLVRHPMYKKYIRRFKKYTAHDEGNDYKVGDEVLIEECRPLSKMKRWRVKVADTPSDTTQGLIESFGTVQNPSEHTENSENIEKGRKS